MATVTQSNIGLLHDAITIQIEKNDYLLQFETAIKSYAKNANIPGFRKGMVPSGMVKKMYGPSILSDEILKTTGKELENYLRDNKIVYFAQPLATSSADAFKFDVNNLQDYTFTFEIGLQPSFTIPLIDQRQSVDAHRVIVSQTMLEEEIEKIQYRAGKMTDVDTITVEDNALNVSFTPHGSADEADAKKTNSLLVKYFSAKGQALLMGKKVGDTVELILGEHFDEKVLPAILKDLGLEPTDETAKSLVYNLSIDKIAHVEKAVLDAGLYDDLYKGQGIATEEDFREKLTSEIQMYWDGQGRNKLHNDIFEMLVHETPIEIPETFLKNWMSKGGETFKPMEEVEKEWPSFEHSLRWQLISEKIVKDNKLDVTRDEVEMGVRNSVIQYFAQMGMMAGADDMSWLDGVVEKQMKDKKYTDDIINQIITDKIFNTIESQVNIKMHDVSLEEFIKVPSKHHHHH